jgi:DDE_Tnp_1-associated
MRRILPGRERIAARESILDHVSECWYGLNDPRTGNAGLHDFPEILAIAMGAVPCKGQGSVDIGLFAKAKEPFLGGFLKLENGVPSHATPELAEGQPTFPQARSGAVPGGVSAVHDGLFQAM